MKKRIVPVLAALALIVVLAGIAVIGRLVEKYIPTDERLDASEYFGITEEAVPIWNTRSMKNLPGRSFSTNGVPVRSAR